MCLNHFDLGPSPSNFICVEEMCIVLELYKTHKKKSMIQLYELTCI